MPGKYSLEVWIKRTVLTECLGLLGEAFWRCIAFCLLPKGIPPLMGTAQHPSQPRGRHQRASSYGSFKFHNLLWWRLALSLQSWEIRRTRAQRGIQRSWEMKIYVKKRVLRLFLAGEERYQEKYKHQRAEPSPFTATSLPVPRKAQDIHIQIRSHFYIYCFQISMQHFPFITPSTTSPLLSRVCFSSVGSRYPSGVRRRRAEAPHLQN